MSRFEPNPRNAAKNRPLPACGLLSSRKQEPFVTVRRSYDGFWLTCYEAAGHMLISAAWGAYAHILKSIDENYAFVDRH
jgi:hypothetical protein